MKHVSVCLLVCSLALLARAVFAEPSPVPFGGITVSSCGAGRLHASTASSPGATRVEIGYTNASGKGVKKLDWGYVANGNIVARGTDTKPVAAGASVDRTFTFPRDIFPKGRLLGKTSCTVLGVVYADGTAWTNAAPPSLHLRAIATPPPGEDLGFVGLDPAAAGVSVAMQSINVTGPPSAIAIELQYTNRSAKAITSVRWGLSADGVIFDAFNDEAGVAAGAAVDRHWSLPHALPAGIKEADVNIHVLHVNFSDGTQWP